MIAGIRGTLEQLDENAAYIVNGGITYEVNICRHTYEKLAGKTGQEISFHTFDYIESSLGIGNMIPRLVGFLSYTDLDFFNLFITVQGISVKKALKAFALPANDIARAIEMENYSVLKHLPEIGAKTAQKIVMELKGKASRFALLSEDELDEIKNVPSVLPPFQNEAVAILMQMQYSQSEAFELVKRAFTLNPGISSPEELIQEVFKARGLK